VTLVDLRALTKTLATWLAAATSLVFAFSRFLPSGRLGGYSFVDDSWIQMLHTAFAEGLEFGRDIVFTFAPWGFLYGGYRPATYSISAFVWAFLAMAACEFTANLRAKQHFHHALAVLFPFSWRTPTTRNCLPKSGQTQGSAR